MATKIVNNLNHFPISFRDIEEGHFFLDSDGDLCIRIGAAYDPKSAFYFKGDVFVSMNADDKVFPVDVTISVDNYGE